MSGGAKYGLDTFVVRVEDNDMAPAIRNGDYVWVNPDEPAADGRLVGVRDPQAGKMVIRRIGRADGRIVLHTFNPPRVERVLVGDEERRIEGAVVFVGNRVSTCGNGGAC